MESFAKKVKDLKAKRGYTAGELSELSGVPLGTLNKLLAGIIEEPKISTASAIAAALGTSLAAMLDEETLAPTAEDERKLLTDYRASDNYGKALIRAVAEMESGRTVDSTEREEERLIRIPATAVSTTPAVTTAVTAVKAPKTAAAPKTAVLDAPPAPSVATAVTAEKVATVATAVMAEQAVTEEKAAEHAVITLPLFYDAVSAGLGADLSDGGHDTIDVRAGYGTDRPDFALRVSGDSMEPRFKSGDVLLIHQQDAVSFGEFGIFIADGAGYFKRFMGDRLHSLNPNYPDIPLRHFDDYFCCGKVVGHMKKKS